MDTFTKTLRITQVITCALAGGLTVLMAVVIFMLTQVQPGGFAGGKGPQWGPFMLMSSVICGSSALMMLVSFVVPRLVLNAQVAQWAKTAQPVPGELTSWEANDTAWIEKVPVDSISRLLNIFQGSKIMEAALCEGAGVMCAVAYLLEAQWFALVLLLFCIAAMLGRLATKGSLNTWLYEQVTRLGPVK